MSIAKRITNGKPARQKVKHGGVYFYRLLAGEFVETKKMILLK